MNNKEKVENIAINHNYDVREISYKKLRLFNEYSVPIYDLHLYPTWIKVYNLTTPYAKSFRINSYLKLLKLLSRYSSKLSK